MNVFVVTDYLTLSLCILHKGLIFPTRLMLKIGFERVFGV